MYFVYEYTYILYEYVCIYIYTYEPTTYVPWLYDAKIILGHPWLRSCTDKHTPQNHRAQVPKGQHTPPFFPGGMLGITLSRMYSHPTQLFTSHWS